MRLQFADPSDHPHLGLLPFATDLDDWDLPHMHGVLGLHRHVVRLVELGPEGRRTSYVVKELPDHLAQREYRLLRELADDRLPTAVVVAVVTGRTGDRDGLLITRHLDYSLPYRTLLSGRAMTIPYLGERLLDALSEPAGCSTRSSDCSCGSTWPASSGVIARSRTRCSAATPAPSRRTSSTSRRVSAIRR